MQITEQIHAFVWNSPQANNCNTYLIDAGVRVLIDPGHSAYFEHVRQGLTRLGLGPADIDLVIATHAHPDHVEAVSAFDRPPTRFALHQAEWALVEEMTPLLRSALSVDPERLCPDFFLTEGTLRVGDLALEIYHTPGHAPGGVCVFWPEARALFSGDLVFAGGLGRTDLPGGDGAALKQSIRRMAEIEADHLLPGHGPVVEGVEEIRRNYQQVENAFFGYV